MTAKMTKVILLCIVAATANWCPAWLGNWCPSTEKGSKVANWATTRAVVLSDYVSLHSADTEFVADTLDRLHPFGQIETLESQFLSVVDVNNWKSYSNTVVQNCLKKGGQDAESLRKKEDVEVELRSQLDLMRDAEVHAGKTWEIRLNFQDGGAQYLSCIKFAGKKATDSKIVLAYAMFGKKWVEQNDWHLNRDFWETPPVPEKLRNYLEAGASDRLASALEGEMSVDAVQNIDEL